MLPSRIQRTIVVIFLSHAALVPAARGRAPRPDVPGSKPAVQGLTFVDAPYCQVVAFGGSLLDNRTRVFDPAASRWQDIAAPGAAGLAGRLAPGLSWDPLRQRVVLFGGLTSAPSDETWGFDPATRTWAPLLDDCTASPCPPGRYHHAQTWSGVLGGTVIFGGMDALRPRGDTWVFDGVWHEVDSAGPSPRYGAELVEVGDEDPVNRGKLLLHGGLDGRNRPLADTWIFDPLAASWREVGATRSSIPRTGRALAWSPGEAKVILYAGRSGRDGWAFDFDSLGWIPIDTGLNRRALAGKSVVHDTCSGAHLIVSEPTAGVDRPPTRTTITPPLPADATCESSATALCLQRNRFRVEVTYTNQFNGESGVARAIPSSDFAGFFYFTDPANFELLVKILQFDEGIKVFYGQLTNLLFEIAVTDTTTGVTRRYHNTSGECGAIDPAAFAVGSVAHTPKAVPEQSATTCEIGPNTLCFLDGRFQVEVDWHNQYNDTSGRGGAIRSTDLTGMVYFTDPGNIELVIKMLQFPDRVLLFYGVLSDLEYTINLTHLATGAVRSYHNPPGKYCGGIDNNVEETPGTPYITFTDPASGLSTADVHDVGEEIVRFDNGQHLIWAATGATFSGWPVNGDRLREDQFFQVRFGNRSGSRRAYFTEAVRGTICDIEVVLGELVITPTDERP